MEQENFNRLVAKLNSREVPERIKAVETLGELGGPESVNPLARSLFDFDPSVRMKAAEALGKIGDPSAVDPLIFALRDEDSEVKSEVVLSLGYIGDLRAVKPLLSALREDISIQDMVEAALIEMGDKGVQILIDFLDDEYWFVRESVSRVLGEIGNPKAIEPLENILKRGKTGEGLGGFEDEGEEEGEDEDEDVKKAVIESLNKLKLKSKLYSNKPES